MNFSDDCLDCLIVGAGIAGLMAATRLQEAGLQVMVVDKGRGVGGRMASRRLNPGRADHGAQFFTVRSPTFEHYVNLWIEAGAVTEWTRGFGEHDGHPRYRGTPAMTAVAKHLALDLNIQTKVRLTRIRWQESGWLCDSAAGDTLRSRSLVLTPPVPQTGALLEAGGVKLPRSAADALQKIAYDPCFTVLARLSKPSTIPAPGAVQVQAEPIAWIADNQQKGISDNPTITLHAGPDFTRSHLETDRQEVGQMLLDVAASRGWLDLQAVEEMQVHRWLYAQPTILYPERTLYVTAPGPLAFAGDAFFEARVEGAALSGLAAADAIVTHR